MANEWLAYRRWPGLGGAGSAEFVRTGEALLITGRGPSARRDALAARIEGAIRSGDSPQDLLVLCADPSGAARMRRALGGLAGPGPDGVRVATCRELACEVLQQPQAGAKLGLAFTSGRTRILAAYEADFVVEDVKTLGTRPKRLRELLKFLYRGWTELSDEDPDWLFMAEEIDTLSFLTEELSYLGALMEPQISNLATKALRLVPALRQDMAKRGLFVLDYQNLSRASQMLCQLVAGERLVAVADATGCTEVFESYPYLAGIEEFLNVNPYGTVAGLDGEDDGGKTDADAGHGTCGEQGAEAATGTGAAPIPVGGPARFQHTWKTPEDEVAGTADAIRTAIDADQDPAGIGVVTLHPWWARQMVRALEERGVPVNAWYGALKLRGDIRDLDRCLVPRIATLLRLLADPQDATAWRSWFGFGDYLTRSNQFASMRASRKDPAFPADVRRDLEAFGYDLGHGLDPLMEEARPLRGPALLAHLAQALSGNGTVPPALRCLLALGPEADAAQMVADLDRRQFFDGIPGHPGVTVSLYTAMAGLDFERAYLVGFVNGLFPAAAFFDLTKVSIDRQEKMRAQDARTASAMASLGRTELHVGHFTRADHLFAEQAGLRQRRIFAVDDEGRQCSEIEPSIYTDVLLGRA